MIDWQNAQKCEKEYWGNCLGMRMWGEFVKQELYAREMGLWEEYGDDTGELNMHTRSVLDVGGGPCSMTLRCLNTRYPTVIDPCKWPPSVERRYKNYGITYIQIPGEDLNTLELPLIHYNEVWIYNVLQHVQDPEKVLHNALLRVMPGSGFLRIFEWLYIPTSDCHPHLLTPEDILSWLHGSRIIKIQLPRIKEYWSDATALAGVFGT